MRTLFCSLALLLLSPTLLQAQDFTHLVIDPAQQGDNKALADLDGDGDLDFVITIDGPDGATNRRLVWYTYPDFSRAIIKEITFGEFTTDIEAADLDGDGDADIVTTRDDNGLLQWFENPRPNGNPATTPWTQHSIGTNGGSFNWVKDLSVADVDANGKMDVLARYGQGVSLWLQRSADSWERQNIIVAFGGEGMEIGDIDGDGQLDVVAFRAWWKSPSAAAIAAGTGVWQRHDFVSSLCGDTKYHLADLDSDGDLDILAGCSEEGGQALRWYTNPRIDTTQPVNPPTGIWTASTIAQVDYCHTIQVGDMDLDGDQDVVAAETTRSNNPDEVLVYYNDGQEAFTEAVIAGVGLHNGVLGDVDGDGDKDLFGANYGHTTGDINLWLKTNSILEPIVATNPTALDFGTTKGTPVTQTLTVTNTGTANLDVSELKLAGTDRSQFNLPTNPAPFNLAPGATQTLSLTYTPTVPGNHLARLRIVSNATNNTALDIPLMGNVSATPIQLSLRKVFFKRNGVKVAKLIWDPVQVSTGKVDVYLCEKNTTAVCSNTVHASFAGAVMLLEEEDEEEVFDEIELSKAGKVWDDALDLPEEVTLYAVYPNPSQAEATISFGLPRVSQVSIAVYDLLGKRVETVVSAQMSAGRHTVRWQVGDLPSGLYLCQMQADGKVLTQPLTIIQ